MMDFARQQTKENQQKEKSSPSGIFQRKVLSEAEEKAFRNRPIPQFDYDFNKLVAEPQAKPTIQAKSVKEDLEKETVIQEKSEEQPNQTGLPDDLKAGVENLSGYSLEDVRVHYNSPKPEQLQAHAYTQGTEIHVAPGEEKHLPHEAWHVVQQMQGRVKPTMQMKGVQINDNEGLEREADEIGAKLITPENHIVVVQQRKKPINNSPKHEAHIHTRVLQKYEETDMTDVQPDNNHAHYLYSARIKNKDHISGSHNYAINLTDKWKVRKSASNAHAEIKLLLSYQPTEEEEVVLISEFKPCDACVTDIEDYESVNKCKVRVIYLIDYQVQGDGNASKVKDLYIKLGYLVDGGDYVDYVNEDFECDDM
ncbi:MAG TPA: hypothetical protein DCF68_17280 [Cyanothece sp. UBA12306]|nr:hypothetical protein [Cyanothece sp. UBA12306]